MTYLVPISSKGQITIPVSLRRSLNIQGPGDKVFIKESQGRIILEPVVGDIMDLKGILKGEDPDVDKAIATAKKIRAAEIAREGL